MNVYIVNAFTEEKKGGNTAGVVMYKHLDAIAMQKIAKDLNFSETAFVRQASDSIYEIRYFTPNSEVSLCGHATIAAFTVLKYINMVKPGNTYMIKTAAGLLRVFIYRDYVMMEQSQPLKGDCLNDCDLLLYILGIKSSMVGDNNFHLIPQKISTGLWDIMLPVKDSSFLNDISPDFGKLADFCDKNKIVGVHAFTLCNNEFLASCRNFAPLYGINEESATGTSNGALTYYLYMNKVITRLDKEYKFIQGIKMKKTSIIFTKIIENDGLKILVGGSAVILSRNQINLS